MRAPAGLSLAAVLLLTSLPSPGFAAGTPQTASDGLGPAPRHDLVFPSLPASWDEGLPLGNGMLGELVWKNGPFLRLSLDRADLWDLRPMKNLDAPEWKFRWVVEQWLKGDYGPVQNKFDAPYDAEPAPSKIPAAALEFDIGSWGPVKEARLSLAEGLATVRWQDGRMLETFVHADSPAGWFRWSGVPSGFQPVLRMPDYQTSEAAGVKDPVTGQDLRRLGYRQGGVRMGPNTIVYRQDGWGGFYYVVAVGLARNGPRGRRSRLERDLALLRRAGRDGRTRSGHRRSQGRVRHPPRTACRMVEGLLGPFRHPPARSAPGTAMVPGTVQVRRGGPPGRPAHLPAGRLDGRQRQAAAVEGRLPPRPQHPAQLLALLRRRSSGGGAGLPGLAVGHARRIQALHQGLLRDGRPERPRRFDAARPAHGRLDPVRLLSHGLGLAGPALLSPLALQPRPDFLAERAYPWMRDVAVHLEQLSTKR